MISYDENTISEKFLKLPEEIQVALSSVEIGRTIKSIGDKYELKLDQEQILYDQIGLVMLGLLPSKDFVKTFSKEANIDDKISRQIATDVNTEVFDKLKLSMRETEEEQKIPETNIKSNADIYKESSTVDPISPATSRFTGPPTPIMPRYEPQDEVQSAPTRRLQSTPEPISAPQPRPEYTPLKNLDALTFQREPVKPLFDSTTTERDREKYLSHLENPPWKKQPEINIKKETNAVPSTHIEPLVDLLLSNSTGRPTEITRNKVEATVPENLPVVPNAETQNPSTTSAKPTPPTMPSRRIGADPYKEPIE